MTGQGMKAFFEAVEAARQEYETCVPHLILHTLISVCSTADVRSEYKPTLDRLTAERAAKSTEAKQSHLARMMNDMSVSPAGAGSNPFGPHARNEREDRYLDEEKEIERQEEEEEEAEYAEDDEDFDPDVHFGAGGSTSRAAGGMGMSWPRPG